MRAPLNRSTSKTLKSFSNSNNTLNLSVEQLKSAIHQPEDVSKNEWLAMHVIQFHNDVNMLFGVLDGDCNASTCPQMDAGRKYQFLWHDELSSHSEDPQEVSAKLYVQKTLDFVSDLVSNEDIFPVEESQEFPRNYKKIIKVIFKKLLRVHLHVALSHWKDIVKLGMEAHVNAALKHFVLFGMDFKVLKKGDLIPLNDWIVKHLGEEYEKKLDTKGKKDRRSKREKKRDD